MHTFACVNTHVLVFSCMHISATQRKTLESWFSFYHMGFRDLISFLGKYLSLADQVSFL